MFLGVLAACSIPLVVDTAANLGPDRFAWIGFPNEQRYLRDVGFDEPRSLAYLVSFAKKYAVHWDPAFLFTRGDANLRHSPGGFGQWSWLDAWALVVGAVAAPAFLARRSRGAALGRLDVLLIASALAYAVSLVPAALTWKQIPHALRTSLAWPFLAMATGSVLFRTARAVPGLNWLHLGAVAIFTFAFVPAYFGEYALESRSAFDAEQLEEAVAQAQAGELVAFARALPRSGPTRRWYLIALGGYGCVSSAEALEGRLPPSTAPSVGP